MDINVFIFARSAGLISMLKEAIDDLRSSITIVQATHSPRKILDNINPNETNIYFVEVGLPVQNHTGIKLAREIQAKDLNGRLILLASQLESVIRAISHKLQFTNIIDKVKELHEIKFRLKSILKDFLIKPQILIDGKSVCCDDLICLEVHDHELRAVTKFETFKVRGSLASYEKRLPDYFFRCNRYLVVNLKEVKVGSGGYVLSNKVKIHCARSKLKELEDNLLILSNR
ncbi:LytTR family DNA-binding domain-containing protein [Xylocopilactobacillus apicola]|uniref:HTH LytTR-type domain-containing protein n=1 Tax=Xylocopilactobacillus apicola TaxID=2932184 RepID=A0AAU9D4V0_9LACO|nr:LytTR family DNA-binding domain-containing protein [Xylocopilactobacillus apicola]BDR58794.1 hypothetical protein XA3_12350 [Xylocopilactobacillus apicola]